MTAEILTRWTSLTDWISENTQFDQINSRLLDPPSTGISAWARTTAGIVAFLFVLQFLSGVLMAFQYVPTVESAYTTVAYLEKVVAYGSWVRSLHYHSSVLLPIALLAHITQLIMRHAFANNATAWIFAVVFLALVLAAGATGYALPWDARALNGVNVAVSLTGNTPLAGAILQSWLQNGDKISTLTLSRFYGLHVFALPFLILFAAAGRLFFFGKATSFDQTGYRSWLSSQLHRNGIAIGVVFVALAAVSLKFPAPFGPTVQESANYVARPGPQFLWLFEMQKYTDGPLAAALALGFPAVILGGLVAIPYLLKTRSFRPKAIRRAVSFVFVIGITAVSTLTAAAIYQDLSDTRIRGQIEAQEKAEARFRAARFRPQVIRIGNRQSEETSALLPSRFTADTGKDQLNAAPRSYATHCAKCHGAGGVGTTKYPPLIGVSTREEDKLTDDKLIQIINDPKGYGLSADMPSFQNKLTEEEKREIVNYIRSLK